MTVLTETPNTTTVTSTQSHQQLDVSTPTRQQVLNAIVAEAGCPHQLAGMVLSRIHEMAEDAKDFNYVAHLTEGDMRTIHPVMDKIMADHPMGEPLTGAVVPPAGSAHDLINRSSATVTGNVVGIVHTKDRSRGNVYCAVALQLCAIG